MIKTHRYNFSICPPPPRIHKKLNISRTILRGSNNDTYVYKHKITHTIGMYSCVYLIPKIHNMIFVANSNINMPVYSALSTTVLLFIKNKKEFVYLFVPSLIFKYVYALSIYNTCLLALFSFLLLLNSKIISFMFKNKNCVKITFHELERFSPFLILFYIVLTRNLRLLVLYGINWKCNEILKTRVFEKIMGTQTFPLIGSGVRPDGAKNCGYWTTGKMAISYGMPSKHSQLIATFVLYMYFCTNIAFMYKIGVCVVGARLLISRIEFGCHTIQQVIIGVLFGALFFILFSKQLGLLILCQ